MLRIELGLQRSQNLIPIYNPERHCFLCYRGIHYNKWVYLDIFNQIGNLKIQERRVNSSLFLPYLNYEIYF